MSETLREIAEEVTALGADDGGMLAVSANRLRKWRHRILDLLDESEPECRCIWAHPVDGSVDPYWPAELDPRCPVHEGVDSPASPAPAETEGVCERCDELADHFELAESPEEIIHPFIRGPRGFCLVCRNRRACPWHEEPPGSLTLAEIRRYLDSLGFIVSRTPEGGSNDG